VSIWSVVLRAVEQFGTLLALVAHEVDYDGTISRDLGVHILEETLSCGPGGT